MLEWIWLNTIPHIGPVTANALLEYFQDPKAIYNATGEELKNVKGMNQNRIDQILNHRSFDNANVIYEQCLKKDITIITKDDPRYPDRAKANQDSPNILYCKGVFAKLEKTAAIVGPRRCTQEEKKLVVKLTESLVEENYAIVSGMAKGIDSYGHTICLKKGGYTVAVFGCGVDCCYPKEHEDLMEKIIENGLIISEYPPGTKPEKYRFPRRNRIISSWSDVIYVMGGRRKSGADSTIEFAKKYNREVVVYSDCHNQGVRHH